MEAEEKSPEYQNFGAGSGGGYLFLRSGDIENRKGGGLGEKEAMQEGSRIHRKIQGKMGSAYRAEVPLGITLPQGMGIR